jgi:hypothetical protein
MDAITIEIKNFSRLHERIRYRIKTYTEADCDVACMGYMLRRRAKLEIWTAGNL